MAQLKLGPITEDKPVKVMLELPGALHRDLVAYVDAFYAHQSYGGFMSAKVAEANAGIHSLAMSVAVRDT